METLLSKTTGGSVPLGAGDKEWVSSLSYNAIFRARWNVAYSPESSDHHKNKEETAGLGKVIRYGANSKLDYRQ